MNPESLRGGAASVTILRLLQCARRLRSGTVPAGAGSTQPARRAPVNVMNLKILIAGLSLGLLTTAAAANAGALERVRSSGELRVCIWPDYYGITYRNPKTQELSGIDIDLSKEFASELGVTLRYVESSFATLVQDVTQRRCDVAMFAVGKLPQRTKVMRFSPAYLSSDIYAITMRTSRVVRNWSDIDRAGVKVAVQAGTFMEPVMRESLKQAEMVVVRPPATREQELEAGRVDVFMTDYPYSRRLLDNADWARLISPPQPFFVLDYGYASELGDEAWGAVIDAFVARIRRDGTLETAARRHGLSEIVVRR